MDDFFFMREAIREAEKAAAAGEIPVGALVVRDDGIIARGRNERLIRQNPLLHAEMAALQGAAETLESWRLDGCTLYVTLEPCVMCAGAIVQCRLPRVVFGARDPKAGAAGSLYDILRDRRMYHRCAVTSGILSDICASMLSEFFRSKRNRR